MLFDEVAIDPSCVIDLEVLSILRSNFGWNEGRVISELPSGWRHQVNSYTNELPDGYEKSIIKDYIQKLNFPLLPFPKKIIKFESWVELAEEASKVKYFAALISKSPSRSKCWFKPQEFPDYIDESKERLGHIDVHRLSVNELVDTLDIFLKINKRLVLINADQRLFNRVSTDLFKALFKRWSSYGGIEFKVIRSMRNNHGIDTFWKQECTSIEIFLQDIKYKGKFLLVAIDDENDRLLHERYLIGTVCGLQLGYGLEISEKPQSWDMINKAAFIKHQDKFLKLDIRDNYKYKDWLYRPK
jgi:hypothetical protein